MLTFCLRKFETQARDLNAHGLSEAALRDAKLGKIYRRPYTCIVHPHARTPKFIAMFAAYIARLQPRSSRLASSCPYSASKASLSLLAATHRQLHCRQSPDWKLSEARVCLWDREEGGGGWGPWEGGQMLSHHPVPHRCRHSVIPTSVVRRLGRVGI